VHGIVAPTLHMRPTASRSVTGVSRRLQAQLCTSLIFAEPGEKVDGTYPTIKDGDIACLSTALLVTRAR